MLRKINGFTLVEILVVLAILALLVGLVGPRVMKQLGGAKSDTARLQIDDFGAALDLFYLDVGRYPDTQEGLEALVISPANTPKWDGPYLKKKKIPMDPWNNPFVYISPGSSGPFDLYSLGSDGVEGGEGAGADIYEKDI